MKRLIRKLILGDKLHRKSIDDNLFCEMLVSQENAQTHNELNMSQHVGFLGRNIARDIERANFKLTLELNKHTKHTNKK